MGVTRLKSLVITGTALLAASGLAGIYYLDRTARNQPPTEIQNESDDEAMSDQFPVEPSTAADTSSTDTSGDGSKQIDEPVPTVSGRQSRPSSRPRSSSTSSSGQSNQPSPPPNNQQPNEQPPPSSTICIGGIICL